jgi:hypothetical protein
MKRFATTLFIAGLLAAPLLALPPAARAEVSVGISIGIPPPALPVYVQPIAPDPGYIWTPGYWAWDPVYANYYWVPGAWVMPPAIGLLWTPGWWGVVDGGYRWHAGYWGTHVGFYGGVNYGFGYFGTGYVGGRWRGNQFFYNRAVSNVNITRVRNVYVDRTVINNVNVNRVSYNGGRGGIMARPTAAQRQYAAQRRYQPTALQTRQRETAMRNPAQRFNARQPRPAVFATQHAGRFEGAHVVRQPAPSTSRMIAAPERTRTAPENRGRGEVMQAPRDRPRSMQPAPREQRAPEFQRAYPRGNRAQHERGAATPRARQPAPAHTERGGKGNHDKRDDGGHG